MSVELDPSELHFKRPFNREVSQILRLHNPHSDPVAFKVKTTAPKQYCVRPNSGRIEAGSDVEVQVLLQAMKEDPPLDAKCRDKFLVQTVIIPADQEGSGQALWANIEQTNKSSISEKKIRVQFLPADASTPARAANGISSAPAVESTPAGTSPVPEAVTPHTTTTTSTAREEPASKVAAALPRSKEEAADQVAELKNTIAQLTAQLKEQGELRQRKVANTLEEKGYPSAAQAVAHPNQAAGVPLQYVALLCLLSFLVAWIFF
ncbi:hypothetical protein, variant [Verruconis gallopava]|uniref:MSP domain-containing protein n=1 Tax=Verruconis gallopava TaxID=253628 RepID=A0A0D1XRI0_9PEZI|nr:uncharacterized protein PV09_03822 [Verruconis gallopava]XP_016215165.1 hypothetical protein, variant [Verruconis gallopava]KIW05295.1 hypothetical protein PV09_03822 [Verruconis gallopava]KIW05296.1 hypothetical protein, variant [Verruconis gallopava]